MKNLNTETRKPRESEHRVIGSSKAVQRLRDRFGIVIAALREIFDEAAYDRFLLRTRADRSVSSYRDFLREKEASILRKPRCC